MKLSFAGVWACAALSATIGMADEEVAPMPPEWFAPPKTASELGITSFTQSPFLDDRDLPSVEQRLPDDPGGQSPLQEHRQVRR